VTLCRNGLVARYGHAQWGEEIVGLLESDTTNGTLVGQVLTSVPFVRWLPQ